MVIEPMATEPMVIEPMAIEPTTNTLLLTCNQYTSLHMQRNPWFIVERCRAPLQPSPHERPTSGEHWRI
jgi:hypothetical protein